MRMEGTSAKSVAHLVPGREGQGSCDIREQGHTNTRTTIHYTQRAQGKLVIDRGGFE